MTTVAETANSYESFLLDNPRVLSKLYNSGNVFKPFVAATLYLKGHSCSEHDPDRGIEYKMKVGSVAFPCESNVVNPSLSGYSRSPGNVFLLSFPMGQSNHNQTHTQLPFRPRTRWADGKEMYI